MGQLDTGRIFQFWYVECAESALAFDIAPDEYVWDLHCPDPQLVEMFAQGVEPDDAAIEFFAGYYWNELH